MGGSFGTDDYFMETDDEMEEEIDDGEHKRQEAFLIVPQVSELLDMMIKRTNENPFSARNPEEVVQ